MVRTETATARAMKAQYIPRNDSVTDRMWAVQPNTISEKRVTAAKERIFSLFRSYKN